MPVVAQRNVTRRRAIHIRAAIHRHARGDLRIDAGIAIELQLRLQLADVAKLGERRQLVEALEAEVIKEASRGAEQGGAARHVAVADYADPLALFQRLDDVAAHRHAANLLDLAAGDRLAVGNERKGFERGAGVAGLALGPQAGDPAMHLGPDLVAEAGRDFDQLHAARLAVGLQLRDRRLDGARRRRLVLRKQLAQLRQRQRLVGRQQRGFDDAVDQCLVHSLLRSVSGVMPPLAACSVSVSQLAPCGPPRRLDAGRRSYRLPLRRHQRQPATWRRCSANDVPRSGRSREERTTGRLRVRSRVSRHAPHPRRTRSKARSPPRPSSAPATSRRSAPAALPARSPPAAPWPA